MVKVGMFSWFSYPMPIEERLHKIKQAGFDATSLWWKGEDKDLQPDLAIKAGLAIDNIHTPFENPNSFWTDELAGEEYLDTLISCINDCKRHSIPVAVIHITGFSETPPITELGMNRMKKLVDCAERQEVNLALENLNTLEHLDYIFQNIDSDRLGFCYDSGHENCNHPNADCLSRYGDKLIAIHLDDNFGDADTHLLPYDGTANWKGIKRKLSTCRKLDYMTLEVDFNPKHEKSIIYKDLSADDFLALSYKSIQRLLSEQ